MWSPEKEADYRTEIERRYIERTPARRIDEVLPDQRVGRGEMRRWATDNLGEMPPELDHGTEIARHKWFRKMALLVISLQDPDNLTKARKVFNRKGY